MLHTPSVSPVLTIEGIAPAASVGIRAEMLETLTIPRPFVSLWLDGPPIILVEEGWSAGTRSSDIKVAMAEAVG